jgi:ATP-dependent Clp endopeptidase proteolytic subunit ClpP
MTTQNNDNLNNSKNDLQNKILKKNLKVTKIKKNRLKDGLINEAGILLENIILPPMPESGEALDNWLNVYRLKMEVERYNNEQIRLYVDREKMASELTRLKEDHEILNREVETAKINLEITKINLTTANRNETQAQSTNSEAMVYTFAGVVSKDSVTLAITTLDEWSRRKPNAPVKLILTSPGGDILHGLSLYDFILILRNRGHRVTVVIMGFAASMGSILAQAGDRRVMTPNAYLMLHEASTLTLGKSSEIEEEIVTLRKFEEKLIAILCSRGKFTKDELKKKWFKKDLWFDAKECLKLGLIDEIGLE